MLNYDSEMVDLFKALDLDNDPDSIDQFIEQNKIDRNELHIADAPCWNRSQSEFIRASLYSDAECSDAVDQLDIILRN